MANEKTYMARTQMKCDSAANWQKATNFSPLKGEMIIYNGDPPRLKVGDGTTNVNNLPFTTAAIYVGDAAPTGDYDLWVDTSAGTGDGTVQVVIFTQEEKTKLAGIEAGANKYVLPTAGAELGGVKTTSTVSDAAGLTATPIIDGVPYYKETTPNWNENDSTSKGYIDNRPGAFTKTETITLTATAEARDEGDTTRETINFTLPDERMDLIPGETYQVVWDGQTYNWEAKVFYANLSTYEMSTTYVPGLFPLYLICGHMPTGDATDNFPITILSMNGSIYSTEMERGLLGVSRNEGNFTVGTSYSITITGKFDYKLYSCIGNNLYATGIFDNATLAMARNYTNTVASKISYKNIVDKPDGYYVDGEHILNFIGDGTNTNRGCWWESDREGQVLDFLDYKSYEITYNGTTYTLLPHITTNDLASSYTVAAGNYGMAIGKISLLDENYVDDGEETSCPFVIYTNLLTGEVRIIGSSAFSSGNHQITIKGTLVCRHLNNHQDTDGKHYPELFFDNFTYQNFFTKTRELEQSLSEYVSKAGDTMTGTLNIEGSWYPSFNLVPTTSTSKITKAVFEGSYAGSVSISAWEDYSGQNRRILEVRAKSYENSLDSALLLRVCDNNNWSDYKVFHSGTTVPITSGGTGATTAAGALTALGAFPISGGTLTGAAMAGADAQKTLSTAQLRNITISTTDLVEGESTLAEGEIYLVYDGGEA